MQENGYFPFVSASVLAELLSPGAFLPPAFLCVAVFNGVPREFWSTLNAHPYYQWELGIVISSKLRT